MPSFRTQLPSKSQFYRASDFDAGPCDVTIATVTTGNVGDDDDAELKLIAGFREPGSKKLVLNLTRAEAIADVAGTEDTSKWPGVRIRIQKGSTRYQGQKVACMTVRAPATAAATDDAEAVGF